MFKGIIKSIRSEKGQSITEFALILPIIIILLMAPIDFARVIHTRMLLNSAATESLSQLEGKNDAASVAAKVVDAVRESYGDVLDTGMITVENLTVGDPKKNEYTYYVYSSSLSEQPFDKQFEERPSNYSYVRVQYRLSLRLEPLTFVGKMLMGDTITITSREYSRNIYTEGYTP